MRTYGSSTQNEHAVRSVPAHCREWMQDVQLFSYIAEQRLRKHCEQSGLVEIELTTCTYTMLRSLNKTLETDIAKKGNMAGMGEGR